MRRWLPAALWVAVVFGMAAIYHIAYIPDLSPLQAADLISRAPEFSRYARLIKMEGITHAKDSMNSMSYGSFTFQYTNSPTDASPIKANADFRYWEGTWHFNQFDYGCPSDCHVVDIHNDVPIHE
jgi:hypothetical protein